MIELSSRMAVALGPHTIVEEQGLFPAMASDFPSHVAVLTEEHRTVEAVLADAREGRCPLDPTWPQRLLDVLVLLREHILKEQDGVFPAALSTLSTAQWERMDAIRAGLTLGPSTPV
jgi:hemerythrin-like domain-containing protein